MKHFLSAVLLLASASAVLRADPIAFSLQLDSVSNGVFDYSINIPPYNGPGEIQLLFGPEQGILLTGLSGVTGASVSGLLGGLLSGVTFTDSSVFAFVDDTNVGFAYDNPPPSVGELQVTSTAAAQGLVSYDIQASFTDFTGTVVGPVATPEPATASLLGLSLLAGVVLLRRSKRAH